MEKCTQLWGRVVERKSPYGKVYTIGEACSLYKSPNGKVYTVEEACTLYKKSRWKSVNNWGGL